MSDYELTEDVMQMTQRRLNKCLLISLTAIATILFVFGILIGRYTICPNANEATKGVYLQGVKQNLMNDADLNIAEELISSMHRERIREYLQMLSEEPHLAGTKQNRELGIKIKSFWEENGFDHVTLSPYQVLLSYPNISDVNYVELLDEKNKSLHQSMLTEPILTSEENKTNVVPPFNAYSPPGDVTEHLVYVNYGRIEDYRYLEANTTVNVSGKIVLARYGKIFRGDKVKQAELRGAKGVILYSDPEDITAGDTAEVYPNDWWLPHSGVQRGSLYIGVGDPLTPGYPAIATAYRKKDPDEWMPGIPCHPVGYGFAIELMQSIDGDEVPNEWKGGMNVTYRFGSSFQNGKRKAHLHVSTKDTIQTIYNVIGIIRGDIEPDRYVLVGNHRDAWVFGALDPLSGTATMMEMSRVMGQLVKAGRWRPRRSIIFCSWGAEEFGLVGSSEWVEHYAMTLGARAIAYLNIDIAVEGNFSFRAFGTPLMYQVVYEATKKVLNPNLTEVTAGRSTVYDTWINTFPKQGSGKPAVKLPGSGSDYAPFRDRIGIPFVDIRYTWDSNKIKMSTYPMYHSLYETFYLVDKIMDRGFKYHTAVGQVWIEMTRNLADSLILPFNVSDYASVLMDLQNNLLSKFGKMMTAQGINTDTLTHAIHNFSAVVHDFENRILTINKNDPFDIRKVNDQMMQLDRAFLDPFGLPGRKYKRNLIFTESNVDSYSGSSFPGLVDTLSAIEQGHNVSYQWEVVKKHFSVIIYTIQSAASVLKDVSEFVYDY